MTNFRCLMCNSADLIHHLGLIEEAKGKVLHILPSRIQEGVVIFYKIIWK